MTATMIMEIGGTVSTEHLTELELSGFLDQDLSREELARVEEHLAQCDACRRELMGVSAILGADAATRGPTTTHAGSTPTPRRLRRLGLAAGIVLALTSSGLLLQRVARPSAFEPNHGGPSVRTGSEGERRIDVVEPATNARLAGAGLVFTWHDSGAGTYRFALLSEDGTPLWTHETSDTLLRLPDDMKMEAGAYFWRVDAIEGAETATTGVHRFVVESP
jgi:hypothetical protein